MALSSEIDIQENTLRRQGALLNILLKDQTTRKNIIWGTDSYAKFGKGFQASNKINKVNITGKYKDLIQPRAVKDISEQRQRTRDKAEVFTPLRVVDRMNKAIDLPSDGDLHLAHEWQQYVSRTILEISCGEAPFIVSRYNPTSHTGKLIKLSNRVGLLDRKLRLVSKNCHNPKQWIEWAKTAFKSTYGYEWQGDSLLIARENLLYTLIDYFTDKFGRRPTRSILTEFADIISWNIFQMDGIKYVVPMSCKVDDNTSGKFKLTSQMDLNLQIKGECNGCMRKNKDTHNGIYVNIMDWEKQKSIRFVDIGKGE